MCVIRLRESSTASKMIHTKVHIHYAKVPVIAVFHLQNPYSFVDVTYEEKKK